MVQRKNIALCIVLSIVTCGIYGLYWAYRCGEKIDRAHELRGEVASNGGILYLILYFFVSIIALAVMQNEVNKFAYEAY